MKLEQVELSKAKKNGKISFLNIITNRSIKKPIHSHRLTYKIQIDVNISLKYVPSKFCRHI